MGVMDFGTESDAARQAIDRACEAFRAEWQAGRRPRIEGFLDQVPPEGRAAMLSRLILVEVELRSQDGERPARAEYRDRFPDDAPAVDRAFEQSTIENVENENRGNPEHDPPVTQFHESSASPNGVSTEPASEAGAERGTSNQGPGNGAGVVEPTAVFDDPVPTARGASGDLPADSFGRYRPIRLIGEGGFGRVFLARDDELDRNVALKVLRPDLIQSPDRIEDFLTEARNVASLKHPAIVAVHDIGRHQRGELFVVLDFIEGQTLADLFRHDRPEPGLLAELLIRVAEAVHHAHGSGLVHRDLKPSNILIDTRGEPHVADFGLAVSGDMQRLRSGEIAGTPTSMAPEQVRGETHRLDGRTDVWALGVILYQGLTGHLPFVGRSRAEIFEAIVDRDPKPPRQIDRSCPRELERICLKCLAKRMTDRYATAAELAEDLRCWLALSHSTTVLANTPLPSFRSGGGQPRVVPKGLRAFDARDADFFLALVPGPRDRNGLPESVRFWKARIEETVEEEKTFSVGLLYGPTGCGKSSLVGAGIIPRLASHVRVVTVESSPSATESRLLAALRRAVPALPADQDLPEAIAMLREDRVMPDGDKVLIVLDQFEQWLHAHPDRQDAELVRALRQCDGRHVSALILVRDDFWMAVTRFLRALEVPLVEGGNSAAVELFDAEHTRKVLIAIGRACGRLPEEPTPPGPEASRFLDQAVRELAGDDGRVIPVRLVLFAEMVRRRPWAPATFRELGGIEGIGVTFLEETFCARSAPPSHRLHRKAAQAVLRALLPAPTQDIKGKLRSSRELRQVAGYGDQPSEFGDLMRILDAELRMVTPSDPEGIEAEGEPGEPAEPGEVYYQLTHDYLIPPLRQWLTRKQRETQRGRTEVRLATIASLWRERPELRRLPSLLEWIAILWHTRPRSWSADERRMMRAATRHHLLRGGAALAVLTTLVLGGLWVRDRSRSQAMLRQALSADFRELPDLLSPLDPRLGSLQDTLLELESSQRTPDRQRMIAEMLLYRHRPTADRAAALQRWLLQAEPERLFVIREALESHPNRAGVEAYSDLLRDDDAELGIRLRASCALATLDPKTPDWNARAPVIVRALLAEDRRSVSGWIGLLEPVAPALLPELKRACADPSLDTPKHTTAAEAVVEMAAFEMPDRRDRARWLAEASIPMPPESFRVLLQELARLGAGEVVQEVFDPVLAHRSDNADSRDEKNTMAHRQANAAIASLVLGAGDRLWPRLRHEDDPRVRALLIDRLGGDPVVDARLLVHRLQRDDLDASEQYALLLSLAEMDRERLPGRDRSEAMAIAESLFRHAPHPGVHSGADLLLRRWGHADRLAQARSAITPGDDRPAGRDWYLGPNGHTFVVLPGPLAFWMGSPEDEPGHNSTEAPRHYRRIERSIAVATTEVSYAQILRFNPHHYQDTLFGAKKPDSPANVVTWYEAARYCNWLSEQAGIPRDQWCYPDPVEPGMTLDADSVHRTGYRLPTEAEWEYFCRAGTETNRPFGPDRDLLPRYAWTWLNSDGNSHPVARLLPNEYGLFDILGNMWEWCHDGPKLEEADLMPPYPSATPDDPAGDPIRPTLILGSETYPEKLKQEEKTFRMMRGSAYDYAPSMARSARRLNRSVNNDYPQNGFRVVRTLPTVENALSE